MAIQFSDTVRDAQNDAIETAMGASPVLRLYTGAKPANCAAARSGTLAAVGALPADFMSNSAAGVKAKLGTWTATGQAAAGAGVTIGHYAIMNAALTVCHEQGSVTVTGGGGDMTMDNTSVADTQVVTVNTKSYTAGNA